MQEYRLDIGVIDTLDLKIMLISSGVDYPERLHERFSRRGRIGHPANPGACNGVILPDDVAVHLTTNDESPFRLDELSDGTPCLHYRGAFLTEVELPPPTQFYAQKTASGIPFGQCAVLQGDGILSFFYLWPCQFSRNGEGCQFCLQALGEAAGLVFPTPTPEDAGEIVAWALDDGFAGDVQLTGGSRYSDTGECGEVAAMIRGIDRVVGLGNIPGESYPYLSAPRRPEALDEVFDAGADRVAIDLNVWDRDVHARVCPGHARHIGRDTQLAALEYVAEKYGPNKACSAFVVGIEPIESLLEGVEHLGRMGVVPLMSVWMPGTGAVNGRSEAPGLDYYRRAREGFAEVFRKYGLVPPGVRAGAHVCICRDIYDWCDDIVRRAE